MRPLVLAALVAACGKKGPPPPEELLAEAGQDGRKLCTLVADHPGTPAATEALDRMRARYREAAPRILKGPATLAPNVVLFLESLVKRGAADPCDRTIVVSVEREIPPWEQTVGGTDTFGVLVSRASWPAKEGIAQPILDALIGLGGGWLDAILTFDHPDKYFGNKLIVHLNVGNSGDVTLGKYTMPGLIVDTHVELVVQGRDGQVALTEGVSGPSITYEAHDAIRYTDTTSKVTGSTTSSADYEAVNVMVDSIGRKLPSFAVVLGLTPAAN